MVLAVFGSYHKVNLPSGSLEVLGSLKTDIKHVVPDLPEVTRVKKVTAVFGQRNHIYEQALKTHEHHNAVHGYEMDVLRERVVGSYWSKPAYILAQVIEELAKPKCQRNHWIMWIDPDTIVLNPQIPVQLFLPPKDLDDYHFVGTHDKDGFNGGVMFLRVHEWTVKMLVEIIALPRIAPKLDLGIEKAQEATEKVVMSDMFRHQTLYQPRTWYNPYQLRNSTFEGKNGSLLVHFQGLEGDKWVNMAKYLHNGTTPGPAFEMPLANTTYHNETTTYWSRVRQSKKLLECAREHRGRNLGASVGHMYSVLNFQADEEEVFAEAITELHTALYPPRKNATISATAAITRMPATMATSLSSRTSMASTATLGSHEVSASDPSSV